LDFFYERKINFKNENFDFKNIFETFQKVTKLFFAKNFSKFINQTLTIVCHNIHIGNII